MQSEPNFMIVLNVQDNAPPIVDGSFRLPPCCFSRLALSPCLKENRMFYRLRRRPAALAAAALCLVGSAHAAHAAEGPKPATAATAKANAAVLQQLPFANRQDFEDAQRGFLGTLDSNEIRD